MTSRKHRCDNSRMEEITFRTISPSKRLRYDNSPAISPALVLSTFQSPSLVSAYEHFSDLRYSSKIRSSPGVEIRVSDQNLQENLCSCKETLASQRGDLTTCADCTEDCKSGSCAVELSPLCTDQCVVVPCDDPRHEDMPCDGPERVFDVPCEVGADCTVFEELLQCCTDYHLHFPDSNQLSPGAIPPPTLPLDFDLDAFLCDCAAGASQVLEQDSGYVLNNNNFHALPPFTNPSFLAQGGVEQTGYAPSSFAHRRTPDSSTSSSFSSPASPTLEALPSKNRRSPAINAVVPGYYSPSVTCMWDNCNATFSSNADLVGHVNLQHLRLPPPSSISNAGPWSNQGFMQHMGDLNESLSCHWGDCQVYPDPKSVPGPSTGNPVDIALGILANHLFQDHLGLPERSSSPQSSDTSMSNGEAKPIFTTPPEPLTSPPTPLPQEHDCAGTSHLCHWQSCSDTFSSCDELTAHLTTVHVGGGKSHYDCHWEGCGRHGETGFASKQKICRHLQSHTGHRPFQCDVCKQNFSEAATLQQHMRRHTQEKPYVCDFPGCGKAFAITGALTIHKRTHNGEKPFKCTYCNKAFAESSNLSKHLRTHTGARPYACTEDRCSKCFARPDQLARHMSVHKKKV